MIYFLQQMTGSLLIKIGYTGSDDPETRARQLRTAVPEGLQVLANMPGGKADEGDLHEKFAHLNVAGEWFRPGPDLIRFIAGTGRRERDEPIKPATASVKVSLLRPWPLIVYLAGKMDYPLWRSPIIGLGKTMIGVQPAVLPDVWPIANNAIFGTHHYAGPYFVEAKSGHSACVSDDSHGVDAQGEDRVKTEWCDVHCQAPSCVLARDEGFVSGCPSCTTVNEFTRPRSGMVLRLCRKAIDASDLVFAWINSSDCYGTIAEIGYAMAMKKMIWIAGPKAFRDLWFVYEHASRTCFLWANPTRCLQYLLDCHKQQAAEELLYSDDSQFYL